MLLVVLFSMGCEEVIDLDLNDASPTLVIEADLSSPDGVLTVVLSKTGSYFEAETAQKVDGAAVFLENRHGSRQEAVAKGDGIYTLDQIDAAPGDSFKLLVEVDGEVYTAFSTVNAPVDMDTIVYHWYEGDNFFRPGYRFNVSLTDPSGDKNYYRIRVYKGGYLFARPNDMVVFDDTDLDGQLIDVRMHNQFYLEKGDVATVELMSIDRQAWQYFTTLSEVVNAGPSSPAPANPASCFTNGALGYFYAWSCSRKVVVIE